ncbi:unnamed protein product [Protopolystoma xenopodis]|uniref:Uncharacterized protein n=1 Tax=Protopolystoma xenopodis TaxID=117903 RepID=A0A3S5B6Q8_9PLAT|nr:unnamed protein product [Protopolystoma xenopodis]
MSFFPFSRPLHSRLSVHIRVRLNLAVSTAVLCGLWSGGQTDDLYVRSVAGRTGIFEDGGVFVCLVSSRERCKVWEGRHDCRYDDNRQTAANRAVQSCGFNCPPPQGILHFSTQIGICLPVDVIFVPSNIFGAEQAQIGRFALPIAMPQGWSPKKSVYSHLDIKKTFRGSTNQPWKALTLESESRWATESDRVDGQKGVESKGFGPDLLFLVRAKSSVRPQLARFFHMLEAV